MNTEFKGTPGIHKVQYSSGVCIGIGVKLSEKFYEMTANTILPDSDKEYEAQKEEIVANMTIYAAAPELLKCLTDLIEELDSESLSTSINQSIKDARILIQKALNP